MEKFIAILAFVAVSIVLVGCGEEKVVEFGSLQQRGGVYVVPETQKPYSGKFVESSENVVIKAGSFKNGKLHGELTTYRKDGSIDKVETFAEDVLNGKYEKYYENGQIKNAGNLKNKKRDGKWEFYHENGKLRGVEHYKIGEGGNWVEFTDGTSGKPDGRLEVYSESGKLMRLEHYKDGKKDGKSESYSESGKLMRVEHYKDGKPDGKWEFYDEYGKLITEQQGSFSDQRDGRTYKTVIIGTQNWMAENLNYNASGSKCYGNDESNCQKYGRLYDWNVAMKSCPSGWYLPSKDEWQKLVDFAGGNRVSGAILNANSGWNEDSNGTDDFGFSALPGGQGISDGSFYSVGSNGEWWSANEDKNHRSNAYGQIMFGNSGMSGISYPKSFLLSVRCVYD